MHTRRISDKYSENCQRIRCRTRKVQWQCYAWHSSWNRIIKCQNIQIHSEDTWEMLGNYGTTAVIQLCSSLGLEPKYTNKSFEKIPKNTWNITGLKLIHSKSKKVCGFHFSVSKNLRIKCVNSNNKISRQKCVNQSKVVRNASFENKMSKRIKKCVYLTI